MDAQYTQNMPVETMNTLPADMANINSYGSNCSNNM
jgi:hypothetical protein